jgi:hypothetical protein
LAIWGAWQEKRILRRGRLLDPAELHFCQQIGIQHPERIRVLAVLQVPMPLPEFILRFGETFKIGTHHPAGMTLGQGIFALPAYAHHPPLICHELVHVRQYQKLGGIWRFLRRYLRECLYHGYFDSPMEQEARDVSSDSGGRD